MELGIKRQVQIWKKVGVREFDTETQMNKYFFKKKDESDRNEVIIKKVKRKIPRLLSGLEREVDKYKGELPKSSHKERLKRFKEKRKLN